MIGEIGSGLKMCERVNHTALEELIRKAKISELKKFKGKVNLDIY